MDRAYVPRKFAFLNLFLVCLASCGPAPAELEKIAPGHLRIVASLASRGPLATQSARLLSGARAAIRAHNITPSSVPIDLTVLDNGGDESGWDARRELSNAQTAARDPATIDYFGPYTSGATAVSAPVMQGARLAQLVPVASWPGLSDIEWGAANRSKPGSTDSPTLFLAAPSDATQADALATWAAREGSTRFLLLDDRSEYSALMAARFELRFAGQVVGRVSIGAASGWTEFLADKRDFDGVFYAASTVELGVKAAEELHARMPDVPVFTTDVMLSDKILGSETGVFSTWRIAGRPAAVSPRMLSMSGARTSGPVESASDPLFAASYMLVERALAAIRPDGKEPRAAVVQALSAEKWNLDWVVPIYRVRGGLFDKAGTVEPLATP